MCVHVYVCIYIFFFLLSSPFHEENLPPQSLFNSAIPVLIRERYRKKVDTRLNDDQFSYFFFVASRVYQIIRIYYLVKSKSNKLWRIKSEQTKKKGVFFPRLLYIFDFHLGSFVHSPLLRYYYINTSIYTSIVHIDTSIKWKFAWHAWFEKNKGNKKTQTSRIILKYTCIRVYTIYVCLCHMSNDWLENEQHQQQQSNKIRAKAKQKKK